MNVQEALKRIKDEDIKEHERISAIANAALEECLDRWVECNQEMVKLGNRVIPDHQLEAISSDDFRAVTALTLLRQVAKKLMFMPMSEDRTNLRIVGAQIFTRVEDERV